MLRPRPEGSGGRDKGSEQAEVVARLRMPLHRDHERGAISRSPVELDGLDHAIVGPRSRDQACPKLVNGLVVVRRHRGF